MKILIFKPTNRIVFLSQISYSADLTLMPAYFTNEKVYKPEEHKYRLITLIELYANKQYINDKLNSYLFYLEKLHAN